MLDDNDTPDDAIATRLDAAIPVDVHRLPGESAINYSYFLQYLAMGMKRGLHPLARAVGHDDRQIERLSSRFHWHARAQAYDDALQAKELRAIFLRALDAISAEKRQAE